MNDFVVIEVLFKGDGVRISIPVASRNPDGLSSLVTILNESHRVVAFKVIDSFPVAPNYFGWVNSVPKWVLKFTEEMYEQN